MSSQLGSALRDVTSPAPVASAPSSALAGSTGATSFASAPPVPATANVATAGDAAAARTRWLDHLTVGAIVLVVVLVSIPRLRAFALRQNELDAVRMLRSLAAHPAPIGFDPAEHDLAALVAQDVGLKRRLEDLEFVDGGRLRRHGYLFDMARSASGEPMLRAWPWTHGQTGRGAFVWSPQRGLLGHPNTDGRYAGPEAPPDPAEVDVTWLRMPRGS